LTIVHAGNVNPQFRDPRPLFHALRVAADAGRIDPAKIRVRFLGGGPYAESSEVRQAVAQARLENIIEFIPRVAYADSLRALAAADVLLLLQASEDTRSLVPAKLYEYLRLQKPVMALVLRGEASDVLTATGGGIAIDPTDQQSLVDALSKLYDSWAQGTLHRERPNLALVQRFDRRELTRELAAIFEKLAGNVNAAPGAARRS
jgi:glycosyltransferase involved in cell wall biosynthesis